jgi:transposase
MSKVAHNIYILVFSLLVVLALVSLSYTGFSYYNTSLEERFFHLDHGSLKPSGLWGHGLGIIGSLLIIVGVFSYMARKRFRSLMRLGVLKHWLEFHIFMCTLGPVMVLFHTAFKFGGLVAVSFWSMVAVFLSGVIGRFIYLQIPRSIEGRELSLNEIKDMKSDVGEIINLSYKLDEESYHVIVESTKKKVELLHKNILIRYLSKYRDDHRTIRKVKSILKKNRLPQAQYKQILNLVKNEISLNRRIERLVTMQNLFKYWHVAHLPFALVMLVIMVIHVVVTVVFGFRWIF